MILIVSDKRDMSTILVINYIRRNRIKNDVLCLNSKIEYGDLEVLTSRIRKATSIWMRRGGFLIKTVDILEYENNVFLKYLYTIATKNSNCLGSQIKEFDHNKLVDLEVAQSVGLFVPQSYVVSKKPSLFELLNNEKEYITKTFSNPIRYKINNKIYYYGNTLQLNKSIEKRIPETFFPSLVQEKIEKIFEIRVFFIRNKMYSMAIFSQNDDKTKLDYRNYNEEKQNRNVPFQLPFEIEEKIKLFMKEIDLDCGSIDLIYGKDKKYYFLEVNPVGQFGWVSFNCNYYLEKIIANILIYGRN